jgi:hypothetical protein
MCKGQADAEDIEAKKRGKMLKILTSVNWKIVHCGYRFNILIVIFKDKQNTMTIELNEYNRGTKMTVQWGRRFKCKDKEILK